jgi:hypothetical protein
MADDGFKDGKPESPASPEKRAALKKLGRYAAYTAPATLVLLGATTAPKEGLALSPPPSPPPPSPPS